MRWLDGLLQCFLSRFLAFSSLSLLQTEDCSVKFAKDLRMEVRFTRNEIYNGEKDLDLCTILLCLSARRGVWFAKEMRIYIFSLVAFFHLCLFIIRFFYLYYRLGPCNSFLLWNEKGVHGSGCVCRLLIRCCRICFSYESMKSLCDRFNRAIDSMLQMVSIWFFFIHIHCNVANGWLFVANLQSWKCLNFMRPQNLHIIGHQQKVAWTDEYIKNKRAH